MSCGYSVCISNFNDATPELIKCIILLYVTAIAYTLIGIYLYEVIPQEFGIKKSPFFCLKFLCKRNKKKRKVSELYSKLVTN